MNKQQIKQLYNDTHVLIRNGRNELELNYNYQEAISRHNIPAYNQNRIFYYESDWVVFNDWAMEFIFDWEYLPRKFLPCIQYTFLTRSYESQHVVAKHHNLYQVQETDRPDFLRTRAVFGINIHPKIYWKLEWRGGHPIANMESNIDVFPQYNDERGEIFFPSVNSIDLFETKLIMKIANPERYV